MAASAPSSAALFMLSVAAAHAASANWPPIPPVRPPVMKAAPGPEAKPAPSAPPASTPVPAPAAAPAAAEACLAELKSKGVEAEAASAAPASSAGCGIASPVRLKSVGLAGGGVVDLPARPMLECAFAVAFTDFLRDLVVPLSRAQLGAPVVALDTGPGYDCRPQDHIPGARVSPHGMGIAIDVAAFVLADKRRLPVGHDANAQDAAFMQTIRRAGCGWFTTILGPGDPDHAEHFHFDIKQHGASENYRICE